MSAARRARPFAQVDVFTDQPMRGNALAVVLDGSGLDDATMQQLARWTQLSETTFLLPPTQPQADYRVRIFTPGGELPFAGHPTLGSCHAWLAAGGQPKRAGRIVQECAVGLVALRQTAGRLAFAAPDTRVEPVDEAHLMAICAGLGLDRARVQDAAYLTNGPRQLTLLLDSAATVSALQPDHAVLRRVGDVGVVGPYPDGCDLRFEVRFFAVNIGVEEDPVTGSLNANIAQWLIGSGRAPAQYVAAQGAALGRAGRVHVQRDHEATWIGGDVVALVRGELTL